MVSLEIGRHTYLDLSSVLPVAADGISGCTQCSAEEGTGETKLGPSGWIILILTIGIWTAEIGAQERRLLKSEVGSLMQISFTRPL